MKTAEEITVFIAAGESTCDECGQKLGSRAWIVPVGEHRALCLSCADLDHLVFLPAGDAALTRRSRKHSTLSAVVLKWSGARKRYERQGVLVEETGLAKAEVECLADAQARACRAERERERRAELDQAFVAAFARRVRELFPGCPIGREQAIAEHACLKYSARVGRSAAARSLDGDAVRLATAAHVRHVETPYDELLAAGQERIQARRQIDERVRAVLAAWQRAQPAPPPGPA